MMKNNYIILLITGMCFLASCTKHHNNVEITRHYICDPYDDPNDDNFKSCVSIGEISLKRRISNPEDFDVKEVLNNYEYVYSNYYQTSYSNSWDTLYFDKQNDSINWSPVMDDGIDRLEWSDKSIVLKSIPAMKKDSWYRITGIRDEASLFVYVNNNGDCITRESEYCNGNCGGPW